MKKQYNFNVQVQITLDDAGDEGWNLPENIPLTAKKAILGWLNEINEYTDSHFEDSIYEVVNCPVDSVKFSLE